MRWLLPSLRLLFVVLATGACETESNDCYSSGGYYRAGCTKLDEGECVYPTFTGGGISAPPSSSSNETTGDCASSLVDCLPTVDKDDDDEEPAPEDDAGSSDSGDADAGVEDGASPSSS